MKQQEKKAILKLKDGEVYEAKDAEIWYKHGTYFLFEVKTGGYPIFFIKSYSRHKISHLISDYLSWT